jgi:hypothetical protein
MITEPHRVEAALFGGQRDRSHLRPADVALDLRKLDPNPKWQHRHQTAGYARRRIQSRLRGEEKNESRPKKIAMDSGLNRLLGRVTPLHELDRSELHRQREIVGDNLDRADAISSIRRSANER